MKKDTFQINDDGVSVTRGECLIINQTFVHDPKHRREGTEKDEIELIRTWQKLGCKDGIMVERDLTRDEMITTLIKFRLKLKRSLPDFMVVIILSHGKRDIKTGAELIMGINMNGLPINYIKNMFVDGHKCPCMIGRPKLFFIQACRGTKTQRTLDTMPRYLFFHC